MASVNSLAQYIPMSVDETVEASPEHSNLCTEARDDTERESLSQPLVNFLADATSSQECSQAPTSGAAVAVSQQPSPQFLMSLGIKVRDFAYENTLPAIVPVPRVPRQMQPAPRALKRSQREWDGEGPFDSLSPMKPFPGQTRTKKHRSLERKPTEPLQEPVVHHSRTLERITVKRVRSIFAPPSRGPFPTPPRTRFSASPPTSPLSPPFAHLASQESECAQTPSAFPYVVHVDDPDTVPASQLDAESEPLSLHPVLYTQFTLGSRSSAGCSPVPSPPQNGSPAPLLSPFLDLPSTTKESGADPRVRKHRGRGMPRPPPSNRYQLRQRPIPSSRASTLSRYSHQAHSPSKSLPPRTRRVR